MTNPTNPREVAKRAGRAAFGPVMHRRRPGAEPTRDHRLERHRRRARGRGGAAGRGHRSARRVPRHGGRRGAPGGRAAARRSATPSASILTELGRARRAGSRRSGPAGQHRPRSPGTPGRRRLSCVATSAAQIGEVRSGVRLTQSLVERVLAAPGGPGPNRRRSDRVASRRRDRRHRASRTLRSHRSSTPFRRFDLLYRAFEDRHRGSLEEISRRQREDYFELLRLLPNPELPIADLGCGRGELVRLLTEHGATAVGVDTNTGQVADDDQQLLIEDDLFRWLDGQPDGSLRAVTSAHVVEHLPTDLQIRLVFEAYRVLAPGGVLVLETPNALSISHGGDQLLGGPDPPSTGAPAVPRVPRATRRASRDTDGLPLHPVDLDVPDHGRRAAAGQGPQLTDLRPRRPGVHRPPLSRGRVRGRSPSTVAASTVPKRSQVNSRGPATAGVDLGGACRRIELEDLGDAARQLAPALADEVTARARNLRDRAVVEGDHRATRRQAPRRRAARTPRSSLGKTSAAACS